MVKVFISYRRDDGGWAGRIQTSLEIASKASIEVFLDVEDLPVGDTFPTRLRDEIDQSDVVLALIAPTWVARAERGDLNKETDWIRKELDYALRQQKIVIPIFIEKANIPELPEELLELQSSNGLRIEHRSYGADISRLTEEILSLGEKERTRRVTARRSGLRSALNLATRRISQFKAIDDEQLEALEEWLQTELVDRQVGVGIPESLEQAGFEVAEPNQRFQMRGISYRAIQLKEKLRLQIGMSQHNKNQKVIMVYDALDDKDNARIIVTVFEHPSEIGDDILHILGEPKPLSTDDYRLPYVSVFFSPIRSEKRYMQTYYPYVNVDGEYSEKGVDSNVFATLFDIMWLGSAQYTENDLQDIHDQISTQFGNFQIIHASEFPNPGL